MGYLQELRKLSLFLQDKLVSFAPFAARGIYADGRLAQNSLFMSGNVVADETVTIGTNVFKCKAITTDTTRTALALNNTDVVSQVTLSGAPGVALANGDLIRIDNEIMKIIDASLAATFKYTVVRARSGTTIASHAGGASVFQAAVATTTEIPVGVNVTLTPVVFLAALIQEINNAVANGQRVAAKASTIFDPGATYADGVAFPDSGRAGKVIAYANSTDTMIVTSAIPENSVLATTETLTNGAWNQGATLIGGTPVAIRGEKLHMRVPTAAEVTQGKMFFKVGFTPRINVVDVRITATGVAKGWNGGVLFVADPTGSGGTVVVDNTGATDWATTDTVMVWSRE